MLKERTKAGWMLLARKAGLVAGVQNYRLSSRRMVSKGNRTATDAVRLFKIHPATVSRLLAREPRSKTAYAKYAK